MLQTSQQYDAVITQCRDLFSNKMKDYGSAWRILRLPSLTDQIFIKAQRIRGLQTLAESKVDEGQESEFIGIINYSVMALVQIDKGVAEQPDLSLEESLAQYDHHVGATKQLMMDTGCMMLLRLLVVLVCVMMLLMVCLVMSVVMLVMVLVLMMRHVFLGFVVLSCWWC